MENYELTQRRVQLFKSGMSQNAITELFENEQKAEVDKQQRIARGLELTAELQETKEIAELVKEQSKQDYEQTQTKIQEAELELEAQKSEVDRQIKQSRELTETRIEEDIKYAKSKAEFADQQLRAILEKQRNIDAENQLLLTAKRFGYLEQLIMDLGDQIYANKSNYKIGNMTPITETYNENFTVITIATFDGANWSFKNQRLDKPLDIDKIKRIDIVKSD
jgi:multidrug efflux pump subunit AcrA (membrane-fusion protein)